MVRVISVHHFLNQNIQTVEQPTACTVAPPHRLLLALTSNCIEVRDLKNDSDVLFTFPTVDEVIQMVHCLNGDYVATVETKFNRQNKEINFVRVYINWDSVATMQQSKMTSSGVSLGSSECGMVQPMRARIAGRVTPTTNQSELGSLEMIEIPVKRNPHIIDCCQVSGNLLILSDKIINLYTFQVRTHDISKLRFIDFKEADVLIDLPFNPTQVKLTENYISCMNKECMYMFAINGLNGKESNGDSTNELENGFNFTYSIDGAVDYQKLIKDESLNSTKEKITINLPSIVRENSVIHKNSPFTFCDKDMVATVHANSSVEGSSQNYFIQNLIQMRLIPILVESAQKQVTEEFKCIVLKPLYIDENLNVKTGPSPECDTILLRSDYRKCLNSVVCMIATQQEGYLYQFDVADSSTTSDNCIAVYPFTAPVSDLIMEDYFLHALTETGLESYTLRFGHQLCRRIEKIDNINVACPSVSDSICLVGLRPFLGVEKVLLSENNLILLANAEGSPAHSVSSNSSSNVGFWTLYNLELPSPKTVFNDVSVVANIHRFTSVQTYCHLMSEAHMILRVALLLKKWAITGENVKIILLAKRSVEDIVETYRISCALLGDHFIMCPNEEDYILAIPYYKMARILPWDVLRRVKKVQDQSNNQSSKGLIHYLKSVLLEIKQGSDADKFFGSSTKQNFSENLLELFENHGYEDLPNLILKSRILREYSTDKLIHILSEKLSGNFPKQAEKSLALAILHIQKCNMNQAQESLEMIPNDNLYKILQENWELLFETTHTVQYKSKALTTFSELSVLLISVYPEMLSELLVYLMMDSRVVNLSKMIKVFLEYLPSSIGSNSTSASLVLQKTLEQYFNRYFSKPENADLTNIIYERGANEAMKLIVRSYLSQLQILQMKLEKNRKEEKENSTNNPETKPDKDYICEENDDAKKAKFQTTFYHNFISTNWHYDETEVEASDSYLFARFRQKYLDEMPPFQHDINMKRDQPDEEADSILKKLQALICSQVLPKQIISEVTGFLGVNENLRGSYALQSLTMTANDGVLFLIDVCPQCLLQFGKDRFTKTDEWKFLIATVQRRILKLSQDENLKETCSVHKKILNDILTHLATSMTLDELVHVFPQKFSTSSTIDHNVESTNDNHSFRLQPMSSDSPIKKLIPSGDDVDILSEIQNYEPYMVICKETMHANQMNDLISFTGKQLLVSLVW